MAFASLKMAMIRKKGIRGRLVAHIDALELVAIAAKCRKNSSGFERSRHFPDDPCLASNGAINCLHVRTRAHGQNKAGL
jgi:hypothetical protein